MIIREIELNNFRIYKGKNKIELFPDGNRNLIIVSGNIMVLEKQLFSCR